MARIGLQLWTIRDACDGDLEGTLHRVGEIGYDGVELFQLHGHEPEQVRAWLDAAGLVAAGRHAHLESFEEELPQLADELLVLGTDRAAQSWVEPEALADPDAVLARIEAAARAARSAGIRFGFHNHWTEPAPVDGGASFLDRLRALPADLVWLELDLGWIWQAGVDPVAELAASHGRCPLVHVKDYRSRDGRDDVPVGDGVVGYGHILPAALAAGAEWLVVEEDEVEGDPFEAVERSLAGVRLLLGGA